MQGNEANRRKADESNDELLTDGGFEIIWEIYSEQDGGPVTEYRDRDNAEERAEELDEEFPYQDHYVAEKKIYFDGGIVTEGIDAAGYIESALERAEAYDNDDGRVYEGDDAEVWR